MMLHESIYGVGACSPSPKLLAVCEHYNYRWFFHTSNASRELVISRSPVIPGESTIDSPFSPIHVFSLPSTALSISLHRISLRIAVACIDGQGILFGPVNCAEPFNDIDVAWHTEATWR